MQQFHSVEEAICPVFHLEAQPGPATVYTSDMYGGGGLNWRLNPFASNLELSGTHLKEWERGLLLWFIIAERQNMNGFAWEVPKGCVVKTLCLRPGPQKLLLSNTLSCNSWPLCWVILLCLMSSHCLCLKISSCSFKDYTLFRVCCSSVKYMAFLSKCYCST